MTKTEALAPAGTGIVTVYLATVQTALGLAGLVLTLILTYFLIKKNKKEIELKDAQLEDIKRRRETDLRCKGCDRDDNFGDN